MDNIIDISNTVESPIIEQIGLKYKLNLKYGGLFRLARNSCKKVYSFGKRKCIHIQRGSYNLNQLLEEVTQHYPVQSNDVVLSILFVDKCEKNQTFIQLDSDEKFLVMLNMYEEEKEVTIYVTTDTTCLQERSHDEVTKEPNGENGSDSDCQSENSYHSRHNTDDEFDKQLGELEGHSNNMNVPTMELHKKFPNVIEFRRALNNYAVINEFEYNIEKSDLERFTACCEDKKCEWRIHASTTEDKVTFQVKKFVETHSCTRSNKCGNKRATQGWIAHVLLFQGTKISQD